ncbi:MAG: hypothetical protein AAF617_11090 [Bacteroidota bacterium]
MKKQELIFEKFAIFLKSTFGNKLIFRDDEKHITLATTGIWIAVNSQELSIGYGMNHREFNPEYEDISNAVTLFFDLLTKTTRITSYYKGTRMFKCTTVVEGANGAFNYLSTTLTWLFPYWKNTTEVITFKKPLLSREEIQDEIQALQKYAALIQKS